ncbi:MAG: CHAT domain-containing protein [Cyclobacteriaceae bacterium]
MIFQRLIILILVLYLSAEKLYSQTGTIPTTAIAAYDRESYEKAIQIIKSEDGWLQSPTLLNFAGRCAFFNFQYDSASYYFNQAYQLNPSDSWTKIKSLLGKIDVNIRKEQISDAITSYKEILTIDSAKTYTDSPDVLLRRAGIVYFTNYPNAENSLRKVFPLMPDTHPDKFMLYDAFLNIMQINSVEKVDSLLTTVNRYVRQYHPGDTLKMARLKFFEAYQLYLKRDYQSSIDVFDDEIQPLITRRKENWALFLESEYHRLISFPIEVLQENLKLIKHQERYLELAPLFYQPNHFRFSETYKSLSTAYYQLGRDKIASAYLDQVIENELQSESNFGYRNALFNKGLRSFYNRDYEEAEVLFQKLLNINDQTGRSINKDYEIYQKLSIIAVINKDYKKALQYNDQLITFKDNADSIGVYGERYKILRNLDRAKEAAKALNITLIAIEEKGLTNNFSAIIFLNVYLQHLIEEGKEKTALSIIDDILTANSAIISAKPGEQPEFHRLLVQTFYLQGSIYESLYNRVQKTALLDSAYMSYLTGLDKMNAVKKEYKSVEDRLNNISPFEDIYHSYIRTAHLQSMLSEKDEFRQLAFLRTESYLSSQLHDELNRNLSIQQTSVPESLLLKIDNLKQQASYLNSKIALLEAQNIISPADSTMLASFKLALTRNTASYNAALTDLETNYTNYFDINYEQQLLSMKETQSTLDADEAMFEYLVDDEALYAFVLTTDQSLFLKLPPVDTALVNEFRLLLRPEKPNSPELAKPDKYRQVAYQLYESLVKPGLDKVDTKNIRKLTIVSDSYLNFIPFELLITDPGSTALTYGQLPYLAKQMSVSYAYSASVLHQQILKNTDKDYQLLAYAPSYSGNISKKSVYRNDEWSELLFNEAEIDNISKYYPAKVVKGTEASEKNFLQQYDDYSILHLAMHAKVDLEDPQRSRLVFTPSEDTLNDGRLHSFELYNTRIDNQLTVLSACNTGSGELTNGEGIMSLARAFTYAGSKSVIMSHWQVDDQSTNFLMAAFYRHLSEGQTKSDALRLAKLDYLTDASPAKQHPFFWGAFVMIGDNTPIPPAKTYIGYYLTGVVLLLLLLGFFYFRSRRTT